MAQNSQISHTDCRSEIGITIGLIDSLIFISRILSKRNLGDFNVGAALSDLASDEDFNEVIKKAKQINISKPEIISDLDKEKEIVLRLGDVWNKYLEIPEQNDLERKEFCSMIHRCQDSVAAREMYRQMRKGGE